MYIIYTTKILYNNGNSNATSYKYDTTQKKNV